MLWSVLVHRWCTTKVDWLDETGPKCSSLARGLQDDTLFAVLRELDRALAELEQDRQINSNKVLYFLRKRVLLAKFLYRFRRIG